MHILAAILMFVFLSIGAAAKGDYSGIAVIGKFLQGFGLFFIVAIIFTGFSTEGCGHVFLIAIICTILGSFLASKE